MQIPEMFFIIQVVKSLSGRAIVISFKTKGTTIAKKKAFTEEFGLKFLLKLEFSLASGPGGI
jgi:hypothetical protein